MIGGEHVQRAEDVVPVVFGIGGEADEPAKAAKDQLDTLLKQELPMEKLLEASPDTPALTDDRPINEYYAWREWRQKGKSLTLDRDSD